VQVIAARQLAAVTGGWPTINAPITVGNGGTVDVNGPGALNAPITFGNNNTVTTRGGVHAPLTIGFGNRNIKE
jgi:hypothetical protein